MAYAIQVLGIYLVTGRSVTRKSGGRVSFSLPFTCNVATYFPSSSSSFYKVKRNGIRILFPVSLANVLANIQPREHFS